jgi:hypothetical protein
MCLLDYQPGPGVGYPAVPPLLSSEAMKRPSEPDAPAMPSLLVFAIAVLVFGSPLRRLWLAEGAPGYLPFLVWLGVIALGGWVAWRSGGHDT